MQSKLNPYISFKDNAREAMEFYHTVFGGKLTMTTFKEGNVSQSPQEDNKIMHSMIADDSGILFMASDTPSQMQYQPGKSMSMSISGENEDELTGYWNKLSVGATEEQPLTKAPWGDTFGMLTDKFGIRWMVNISVKK